MSILAESEVSSDNIIEAAIARAVTKTAEPAVEEPVDQEPEREDVVRDEVVDEPEVKDELEVSESEVSVPSMDDEIVLPDGTKRTYRQLQNEMLMQSDYTRKTSELSDERNKLALETQRILEYKDALESQKREFEERKAYLERVDRIRRNPEAREELASLLENYGEKDVVDDVRKDPILSEMKERLDRIDQERIAAEQRLDDQRKEMEAKSVVEEFNNNFSKLQSEKYRYASFQEVKGMIVDGECEKIEEAMKRSHDRVQSILTETGKKKVVDAAKASDSAPPSPTKTVTTPPTESGKAVKKLKGSIFDKEFQRQLHEKVMSAGNLIPA